MKRKIIIPLVQYSHPDELITKQIREEANNKFYKKINTLKLNKIKVRKMSPIRKIKKNYSLPKINLRLSSINSLNSKDKDSATKERESVLSSRDKYFDKFLSFEEKMILNYYENAITRRMKVKPKRINNMFFNQFKSNFQKSKEKYRRMNEMRLNKENNIYKSVIKRFSDNYANFSNNKSYLNLRSKIRLKINSKI